MKKTVIDLLWQEANKRGLMGDESVTIKLPASEIDVDTLPDFVGFEKEEDMIYLSCEAENLY